MIIDFFGSLKDNLIKKVKNPFLGTFGIVFVLKNWQLFYSLLYFDAGETRLSRIEVIENYLSSHGGTWGIFGVAVGYTLIVLVLSYSLSLIGTYIANFSDTIAIPWVVKLATKGAKIVTKETYDKLDLRCKKLENDIREERVKRIDAESDREKAEKELFEFKNDKKREQNPKSMKDLLFTEEEIGMAESKETRIVNRIIGNPKWEEQFAQIIAVISADKLLSLDKNDDTLMNYLLVQKIITKGSNGYATFTEFGKKVRDLFYLKQI